MKSTVELKRVGILFVSLLSLLPQVSPVSAVGVSAEHEFTSTFEIRNETVKTYLHVSVFTNTRQVATGETKVVFFDTTKVVVREGYWKSVKVTVTPSGYWKGTKWVRPPSYVLDDREWVPPVTIMVIDRTKMYERWAPGLLPGEWPVFATVVSTITNFCPVVGPNVDVCPSQPHHASIVRGGLVYVFTSHTTETMSIVRQTVVRIDTPTTHTTPPTTPPTTTIRPPTTTPPTTTIRPPTTTPPTTTTLPRPRYVKPS